MLSKFTVGNFLSFKDKVTVDMNAEALKEYKNYLHIPYLYNPKVSLIKSLAIYGYNSFGKSNLIKSYDFFRNLILTSFTLGKINKPLGVKPFLFNTSVCDKPSYFEVIFFIKNTKYRYGFELVNDRILSEWLYYADGPVRENALFDRFEQNFREVSKLWNKESNNMVDRAKMFTQPNNLFISVLLSQANIPPRIEAIANWFKGNIILSGAYGELINNGAAQIYTNDAYRNIILKFLESGDLGFKTIYDKVAQAKEIGWHKDLANFLYETETINLDLYTRHNVYDENYKFQKITEFELLKNESSGSIKYFIITCFLAYALKHNQLIWIDELDASIHTQLLVYLLEIYNNDKNNRNGSQLIFTTHNTTFLNKQLRRDQVLFVDKNEFGESSLHKGHTSETPLRINKSIEQEYRQGQLLKGVSKKIKDDDIPNLFDELE